MKKQYWKVVTQKMQSLTGNIFLTSGSSRLSICQYSVADWTDAPVINGTICPLFVWNDLNSAINFRNNTSKIDEPTFLFECEIEKEVGRKHVLLSPGSDKDHSIFWSLSERDKYIKYYAVPPLWNTTLAERVRLGNIIR